MIPPPVPADPALFPRIYTSEYFGNYALDSVHAGNAYIAGLTGKGVTVAVIDSGIADIAKLQGQIAQHVNVTAEPTVQDDHGTSVAAVLAAKSDGVYMHGIAYGAAVADIKAGNENNFLPSDLQTALGVAAGQIKNFGPVNAAIINLSLGGDAPISPALRTELDAVVDAGKIIVIAAGNNSGPAIAGANPSALALFAADPDAKGQVIIAGASTQAGTLAGFSDRAGAGKAFYLVAPGDQIATLDSKGAPITVSGTSFSAPIISGAAALLEQEFPNLKAAKVVQILLATADPLATGTSADFGAGLLDLAKAIQPIGALSVPTGQAADGPSIPLGTAHFSAGRAFGGGIPPALAGLHVLAVDSFQRGYIVNLPVVAPGARDRPPFESDFASSAPVVSAAAAQLRLSDAPSERPLAISFVSTPATDVRPQGMDMALRLGGGTVAEFGQHVTALNLATASLPDLLGADTAGSPLFVGGELSVLPQASFMTDGYGVALSHRFSGFRVTASAMSSNGDFDTDRGRFIAGTASLAQVSAGTTIAGIDLGIGVAELAEDGRALGSISSGPLSLGTGAASTFVTVMGAMHISEKLELTAAYTEGRTRLRGQSAGLFSQVGPITSSAFAVAVIRQDGFVKEDTFGVQIAQPIRVDSARSDLLLPSALTADGAVVRSAQHVDLAPKGREIDIQAAYRAPLAALTQLGSQGDTIQAFVMTRFDPADVAGAGPDYVAGIRCNLAF